MTKLKSTRQSSPARTNDSIKEVRVVADHEAAFRSAVDYIDACLKAGQAVPPIMIRHVVWRLKWQNDKALTNKHTRAIQSVNRVLRRLEKLKSYEINWRFGIDLSENIEQNYTLFSFSYLVVTAFYDYESSQRKMPKEKVASFLYQLFMEEVIPYLAPVDKSELSKPYKFGVLIGVYTEALGYQVCSKKNPALRDLYQATRYMIKKIQSQKSA